jgi:hypothetical protein
LSRILPTFRRPDPSFCQPKGWQNSLKNFQDHAVEARRIELPGNFANPLITDNFYAFLVLISTRAVGMKRTRMYQNLLPALDTQRRITNRMRRPWRSSRLKWPTNCSQAYTMDQWLHVIMSKWNVGALAAAELPRLRCAGLMSAST